MQWWPRARAWKSIVPSSLVYFHNQFRELGSSKEESKGAQKTKATLTQQSGSWQVSTVVVQLSPQEARQEHYREYGALQGAWRPRQGYYRSPGCLLWALGLEDERVFKQTKNRTAWDKSAGILKKKQQDWHAGNLRSYHVGKWRNQKIRYQLFCTEDSWRPHLKQDSEANTLGYPPTSTWKSCLLSLRSRKHCTSCFYKNS